MQRLFAMFLLVFVFGMNALQPAAAQPERQPAKRRIFVLHSGMHIVLAPADKNHAARTLKRLLQERGIAARDVVALDSPFPQATWSDPVPREGLLIYLGSADPASQVSQEGYVRLHKALQAQGVTSKDDIVWIGHSAGGQMGMTMANLAHNLATYPALAKKTQPYHFEMVVTLGSAIGSNPVPDDVKLRHYYSTADTMIYALSKHGDVVAAAVDSRVRFRPCYALGKNALVRVFHGIEHPEWYTDDLVLQRLMREFEPYCPPWRRTQADAGRGLGLAQLLAKSLESEWHVSLEEHLP